MEVGLGHVSIRGYRFTCCLISLLTETALLAHTGGSPDRRSHNEPIFSTDTGRHVPLSKTQDLGSEDQQRLTCWRSFGASVWSDVCDVTALSSFVPEDLSLV